MQTSMTAIESTAPSQIRRARRTGAEASTDAPARHEDKERFRRYRATGDRKLRNQLIEDHRWLALHCAKRFDHKGEPLDDLIQVAMLGVLKAVERFDPDFGATFATFAVPTITGELRRHFRDTTWAVHVPRRAKDLQHTVKVAVNELGQMLGRSPTVDEIASQAGVPVEEVLEALEAARCYRKTPLAATSDDGEVDDLTSLGAADGALDAVDATATVQAPAGRAARPRAAHRGAALHGRPDPVPDRRPRGREPGPGLPPAAGEPGQAARHAGRRPRLLRGVT